MLLKSRVLCLACLLFALSIVCINFNSQAEGEAIYRGDLIVRNSIYVISGVYYKQDGNISIENATLVIKNATLEILQDSTHKYRFEVNNSNLIFEDSRLTVATKQLMPYLRLNFTIKATNFTLCRSTISFPGRINIIDSKVEILDSVVTRIETLPEGVNIDDNDDAPVISCFKSDISIKNSTLEEYTQIYFDSSAVFIADSEFKNFHETQEFTQKLTAPLEELEASEDDNWVVLNPGENFTVTNFKFSKELDLIKILNVQLKARIGGEFNYNATDYFQYSLNGEYRNTTITFSKGFTNQNFDLWREGVRTLEEVEKLSLRVCNNDPERDNNSKIVIDYVAIALTYETDILLENTEFYAINSYFDLDFKQGTGSPEKVFQPLNSNNYLFNYEPCHNRLKALNKSFVWLCNVTVDLTETGGSIPNIGNPPFVSDASSQLLLLRLVKIRTTDRIGVPLGNASIEIKYEINNTTTPTPPKIILDFLEKNSKNWNLTSVNGELLIPLVSDLLTPEQWPNSEFIGNYAIIASYENLTVFTTISLAQFPKLTENSNVEELKITFSQLVLPPTSMTASVIMSTTYCAPNSKIIIYGDAKYNNGLPVGNAEVMVVISDTTVSTATSEDGSYSVELIAPSRAQTYTVYITIYDPYYGLQAYTRTRELIVELPPPPPNILLPIAIMVVVAACFSTLLLRNRLKLWFYIMKAKMKKEKFIECSECGYLIPISATKCPACKAIFEEVVAKCSECGAIIPITAEKCPTCGASFE